MKLTILHAAVTCIRPKVLASRLRCYGCAVIYDVCGLRHPLTHHHMLGIFGSRHSGTLRFAGLQVQRCVNEGLQGAQRSDSRAFLFITAVEVIALIPSFQSMHLCPEGGSGRGLRARLRPTHDCP